MEKIIFENKPVQDWVVCRPNEDELSPYVGVLVGSRYIFQLCPIPVILKAIIRLARPGSTRLETVLKPVLCWSCKAGWTFTVYNCHNMTIHAIFTEFIDGKFCLHYFTIITASFIYVYHNCLF